MSQGNNGTTTKTCVCISCFNYYDTRIKMIKSFFESKGYNVTYITSDYNHFEKKHFVADYPDTIQVHVPKYTKNLSFHRVVSQFLFSKKTFRLVKSLNPDIIYCMFPPNSLVRYISKYTKKKGCKLVFDGYDLWPESFPVQRMKFFFKIPFKLWADLRDRYIETADLILVVSQSMHDAVKSKWQSVPIKLLKPTILQTDLPEYGFDCGNAISFCYLGNINYITDIDLLVELLTELSFKKKVILHIIGAGNNLQNLLDRFERTEVQCYAHGVVMDNKKKREIYSKCNFALNVPREEIHSSMSLKSMEYMSVGLPFINSGEGDTREIVGTYSIGYNVDMTTIKQCANNIADVTPSKLEEMHANCLKIYQEKFVSLNLDDVLSEVLC